MSSSYVGGSGSDYGASSSSAGASSALTQSILGAVSLAGENIALSSQTPQLVTPVRSAPITSPTPVLGLSGGSSIWIVILIVVVVGFFAVREL